MFFFGDDQDLVELYINKAISSGGPGCPRSPMDEMTLKELSLCAVYLRIAYKMAWNDEVERETIDAIIEMYDELFAFRCQVDGMFYKRVALNRMNWLGGFNEENITKYRVLAGMREKKG